MPRGRCNVTGEEVSRICPLRRGRALALVVLGLPDDTAIRAGDLAASFPISV